MLEDVIDGGARPRPILIIDDIEAEARWIQDRLLERG